MALYENVKMTVTGSPGTGTVTLNAAVPGSRSFADAGVPTGAVVSYVIEEGLTKEEGRGTYTVSGTTLSRDTVVSSTSGGSKISFGSGAVVYLAPNSLDLFSMADSGSFFRNRVINGGMKIDQRHCGAAYTIGTGGWGPDRFWAQESTDGTATMQQQTTVVPPGFSHALKFTVTGVDSSLTAAQQASLGMTIEGYDVADLFFGTADARKFTVSFWVRASVSGTYGMFLMNGDWNRSYVTPLTINQADTWEYKTFTIQGDTTGTWYNDNRGGLAIGFCMGAGSNYQTTTLSAWQTGELYTNSAYVNLMATNAATFYLTGLQLEVGTVATPFERRPFSVELELCKRYYYKSYPYGIVPGVNADHTTDAFSVFVPFAATSNSDWDSVNISFPVTMSTQPVLTFYNPLNGTAGQCRTQNGAQNLGATFSAVSDTSVTPCVNGGDLADAEVVFFHLAAHADY